MPVIAVSVLSVKRLSDFLELRMETRALGMLSMLSTLSYTSTPTGFVLAFLLWKIHHNNYFPVPSVLYCTVLHCIVLDISHLEMI